MVVPVLKSPSICRFLLPEIRSCLSTESLNLKCDVLLDEVEKEVGTAEVAVVSDKDNQAGT